MEILGRSSLSLSVSLSSFAFSGLSSVLCRFLFILFCSYSNDLINSVYLFILNYYLFFSNLFFFTCIISFFLLLDCVFSIHFAIVPHPTIRLLLACAAAAPRLLACLVPVALPIVPPLSLSCFFGEFFFLLLLFCSSRLFLLPFLFLRFIGRSSG
ncbi:hypothetical protein ASPTUDRAFT_648405 [Aspergillus tubingensis CBS 134.48]|uniref:Uncharacterized protein n=1 Tax=Aspergillus tubingensis (strain CBS 134.48) TaxID=767770 RepID=A0A1L9N539_ASPTC|nr:hypothetical protein ASPTUDRAFT_648405 [Aspergillus tubingensis CBS 134.48]